MWSLFKINEFTLNLWTATSSVVYVCVVIIIMAATSTANDTKSEKKKKKSPRSHLQDLVLGPLVDLSCHAAVGQSVLDDVLVRLCTGLLVQPRPWWRWRGREEQEQEEDVVMATAAYYGEKHPAPVLCSFFWLNMYELLYCCPPTPRLTMEYVLWMQYL